MCNKINFFVRFFLLAVELEKKHDLILYVALKLAEFGIPIFHPSNVYSTKAVIACFYKYIFLSKVYIKARLWLTVSKQTTAKGKGHLFSNGSSFSFPVLLVCLSDLLCSSGYQRMPNWKRGWLDPCYNWMRTTTAWPVQVSVKCIYC